VLGLIVAFAGMTGNAEYLFQRPAVNSHVLQPCVTAMCYSHVLQPCVTASALIGKFRKERCFVDYRPALWPPSVPKFCNKGVHEFFIDCFA
jgi:hypothetical protein